MVGFPAARIGDSTAHGGVVTTGFPTVLIGGKPASRITDMHTCPMVNPGPVPHVGGPFITGAFNVLTGFMPQSRVTDKLICVGPPDVLVVGEPTVLIGTAGASGGMGALLGSLAGALMAVLSTPYPRAIAQADGTIVTEYAEGIDIKGTPEFQAKTVTALDKIAETKSGEAMFSDFNKTGKTVTIVETAGGCGVKGFTNDAKRKADGTRGSGSDSTLEYNPNQPPLGDGKQKWQQIPPEVALGHEMVHATHVAQGDASMKQVENDSVPDPANPGNNATEIEEEVRTTGIPPYDKEPYSENSIRKEWDPPQPQRPYY